MSYSTEPRGTIDCRAIVVTELQLGDAGMQRHAHEYPARRRPLSRRETLLDLHRSCERIGCSGKHNEAAVALPSRFHNMAVVHGYGALDHLVVLGHRAHHDVGGRLPEARASLHVGEEKGDGSARQFRHWRHPTQAGIESRRQLPGIGYPHSEDYLWETDPDEREPESWSNGWRCLSAVYNLRKSYPGSVPLPAMRHSSQVGMHTDNRRVPSRSV